MNARLRKYDLQVSIDPDIKQETPDRDWETSIVPLLGI